MNTTVIAMAISAVVAVGLVVGLGVLSLLSGALHFLFGKPRLDILKSEIGSSGFAFSLKWNSAREPAKFDTVKVRLYNPFGSPTQVDIKREFPSSDSDFAADVDLGEAFAKIISAKGIDQSSVEIEVSSSRDQIVHYFSFKARKFLEMRMASAMTAQEFNKKFKREKSKPVFHSVSRSFIAEPLPANGKVLKMATNPAFAGEFTASEGEGKAKENFPVTKVWIDPGCIVCNACEGIYPEVFEVTEETCLIRPNAPLDNGLLIQEAAEACPVEVIKYTVA